MHFGENQLALGSSGISLLTTTHPFILQHSDLHLGPPKLHPDPNELVWHQSGEKAKSAATPPLPSLSLILALLISYSSFIDIHSYDSIRCVLCCLPLHFFDLSCSFDRYKSLRFFMPAKS
ncbi:hypothetical protein ACET3Z_017554 [Daucus carota]